MQNSNVESGKVWVRQRILTRGLKDGGGRGREGKVTGEKSKDCLTGSESAQQNGEQKTDMVAWSAACFGVNMD